MAEEFQIGSGNWWESAARNNNNNNSNNNRFDSAGSSSTSSNSACTNTLKNNMGMGMGTGMGFGWPTEIVDIKATRSSMDSLSVSGSSSSMAFQDSLSLQQHVHDSSTSSNNNNFPMMGLALPSQGIDWNQALLGEKSEGGYRSMLQEDLSLNTNFQKIYSGSTSEDSSMNDHLKQINLGFSLDQPQFSDHVSSNISDGGASTCQAMNSSSFQMDSSAYGTSPMLHQPHHSSFDNRGSTLSYSYPAPPNYGMNSEDFMPSWPRFAQFPARSSPPKQPPQGGQLHFSNNAPFWNASSSTMNDGRSTLLPSLQSQLRPSMLDEKPKAAPEVRDMGGLAKRASSESSSNKRTRPDTPSSMPPFKVRKEKMGDRITALQQLVSPFGKTDTASVLSEAIEYIKFLHEQVSALSTSYMRSGSHIQHHQNSDKSKDQEGPRQDLRSRGLCLVPVSSTFPVTHETTVDFWTPTFGGTFR